MMMKPEPTNAYPASSHRGVSPGFARDRSLRPSHNSAGHGRFVTQSHALSAPRARPASLAIAAAVAVALVLVTRRLTH